MLGSFELIVVLFVIYIQLNGQLCYCGQMINYTQNCLTLKWNMEDKRFQILRFGNRTTNLESVLKILLSFADIQHMPHFMFLSYLLSFNIIWYFLLWRRICLVNRNTALPATINILLRCVEKCSKSVNPVKTFWYGTSMEFKNWESEVTLGW